MKDIKLITAEIIKGADISKENLKTLSKCEFFELLFCANALREHFKGNKIKLCGIINAKSGSCSENCRFCAQSAHNKADIEKYPLVSKERIIEVFNETVNNKASCYGIVSSGNTLTENEIDIVSKAAEKISGKNICISVSAGALSTKALKKLKKGGVSKIHHNLETSESNFKNICTTQTYSERVETVKKAKQLGFKVCSGALFGIGESFEQRLELASDLKELNIDSIPLNFLNPVKGTPFEKMPKLSVQDILRSIAAFRFIMPDKDISICGGREVNLGDFQSWIFTAGANGMMVGNYLTTKGRSVEADLKMIKDMGLDYE